MSTLVWEDYVAYLKTDQAALYEGVVESAVAVAGEQYGAWPLWCVYLELKGRKGELGEQVRIFHTILKIPMRYNTTAKPNTL